MAGILIFDSLAEAMRMGFGVYDRTQDGYLVRRQTERGYALALVIAPEARVPHRRS